MHSQGLFVPAIGCLPTSPAHSYAYQAVIAQPWIQRDGVEADLRTLAGDTKIGKISDPFR
jgi:hypothetical protein